IGEVHPQQFTEPKSSLLEHQTDEPVAEPARISLWGASSADGVHKDLEVLLRDGCRPAYWLFDSYFHSLRLETAGCVSQQISLDRPLSFGNGNIHNRRLGDQATPH